jgi:hypothetical protein
MGKTTDSGIFVFVNSIFHAMHSKTRTNSSVFPAILLIVIGGCWFLWQLGLTLDFPRFHFHEIFFPFRPLFHNFGHVIFSWQAVLIFTGILLMIGKRTTAGIIVLCIGAFLISPKIFFIPDLTAGLILPIILIGLGVVLIARMIER